MHLRCCFFGHKWRVIALNHSHYTVYKEGTQYWNIRFYQCDQCLKRKAKDDAYKHKGIVLAKTLWKEEGLLPVKSKLVGDDEAFFLPKSAKVIPFKLVTGANHED